MKRKSVEIKKAILRVLSDGKRYTYAELERKVNTGYRSIVSNCEELKGFNAVTITKQKSHEANGRPYFSVEITEQGRNFFRNL